MRGINIFKNFFVKLLLFAGALVVSVAVLEFLIRALLPIYDPRGMLDSKYYPDEDVVLCPKNFVGRLWKNTGDYNVSVSINKYGFRDKKDLSFSAPTDLFVLGDSYSLGWGVEQERRYSDLLESILGIPVYNISVPAGDIDNYQKLLTYVQTKGAKVNNLIITVCMENDLRNYDLQTKPPPEAREASRRKVRRRPPQLLLYRRFAMIKLWLAKNSATYHAFTAMMHQNDTLKKIAVKLGLIIENYAGMQKNIYSDKVISSTARKLLDLSRPFHAMVVIIPSRGLWVGENQKTELAVHNKLVSLLNGLKMNVIDLRPYFEEGDNSFQYHFKNDGHWNERGHLKAAEVIANFLSKK